jgi:hypothetical protein
MERANPIVGQRANSSDNFYYGRRACCHRRKTKTPFAPRFDLYRVPPAKLVAKLIFGGDLILGRSCKKIQKGTDPFEGISSLVRDASFAVANLECTISNLGGATNRYAFCAPGQSAQSLRRAGFDAMGLANNHALDFGPVALHDSAAHLVREEIEPVGGETLTRKACDPSFFSLSDGKRIALLAISEVDPTPNSQMLRPLFERSLVPRLQKRGHTQILSFAWSTGESKTARRSLTNNANSPVGWLIAALIWSLVGTRIAYNRSNFITAVQLRIHSVIWCSMARQPSHHGIAARYSRSV